MKDPIYVVIGEVLDLDFLNKSFIDSSTAQVTPHLTKDKLYELCASNKRPVVAFWQTPGPKHPEVPAIICHRILIEPLSKLLVPYIEYSKDALPQMTESKSFCILFSKHYSNGKQIGTEGAMLTEYSTNWEIFVNDSN